MPPWKWMNRSVSVLSKMNEATIKWSKRLHLKYSWYSFCQQLITLLLFFFFFLFGSFKWVFDSCILIGSESVFPEQNSTLAICSNSWKHQPFAQGLAQKKYSAFKSSKKGHWFNFLGVKVGLVFFFKYILYLKDNNFDNHSGFPLMNSTPKLITIVFMHHVSEFRIPIPCCKKWTDGSLETISSPVSGIHFVFCFCVPNWPAWRCIVSSSPSVSLSRSEPLFLSWPLSLPLISENSFIL